MFRRPQSSWYKRWFKKKPNPNKPSSKSDNASIALNGLKFALRGICDSLDGVPAPGLQGVIKSLLFIADNMELSTQNLESFKELGENLTSYSSLFHQYKSENLPPALREAIETLLGTIRESHTVINQVVDHCRARRIIESSDDSQLFLRHLRILEGALSRFQTATLTYTALLVSQVILHGTRCLTVEYRHLKVMNTVSTRIAFLLEYLDKGITDQHLLLSQLRVEDGAYLDSSERRLVASSCLPHTRVSILKHVSKWLFCADAPPLFWIRGMPGTGKSSVAQSVAECYRDTHLAGHFFFSRDILVRHSGERLSSTLASQLCDFDVRLVPYVVDELRRNRSLANTSITQQFSGLVNKPLQNFEKAHSSLLFPMLVVIDALDECSDPENAKDILSVAFNTSFDRQNRPLLKFLVTSRTEDHITNAFKNASSPYETHDLDLDKSQEDIELYLNSKFKAIREGSPECFESRMTVWPEPHVSRTLAKRSNGLFIYASTVLKFVEDVDRNPVTQLKIVFNDTAGDHPGIYDALDRLYRQTLIQANTSSSRSIIGAIILAAQPFSPKDLEILLDLQEGDASIALRRLNSVLVLPSNRRGPVRLFHKSFYDFMTTQSRSGDLFVNPEEHHGKLARACMRTVSSISSSSRTQLEQVPESPIRYACLFWTHHLCRSDRSDATTSDVAVSFLQSDTRGWFDAMIKLRLLDRLLSSMRDLFRAPSLPPASYHLLCQEMDRLGVLLLTRYTSIRYTDPLRIAEKLHEHVIGFLGEGVIPYAYHYHLGQAKRLVFESHKQKYRETLHEALNQFELALKRIGSDHPDRPLLLAEQAVCYRLTKGKSGLERSLALFPEALGSLEDNDPNKPVIHYSCALTYMKLHDNHTDLRSLDLAIDHLRNAIALSPTEHSVRRSNYLNSLGEYLHIRFQQAHREEDILGAIEATNSASSDPLAPPSSSFQASHNLAKYRALHEPSTSLPAYLDALAAARRVSWSALPDHLARSLIEDAENCARAAAAEALALGKAEIAFQCVRQACSTYWIDRLDLRTPFFPINTEISELLELAKNLEAQERLELLPLPTDDYPRFDNSKDRIKLVKEHRRWCDALEHRRSQPSLLAPPGGGNLVVLNADHSRCDALILRSLDDRLLSIQLPIKLEMLKTLATTTKELWNTEEPDKGPEQLLQNLWDLIVNPVIQALKLERNSEPPRLWWCLTGPFADLPLHAAANYDSLPPDFTTDYMISSYLPNLNRFPECCSSTNKRQLTYLDVCESDIGDSPKTRVYEQIKALLPPERLHAIRNGGSPLQYVIEQLRHSFGVHIASPVEQPQDDPASCQFVLRSDTVLQLRRLRDEESMPEFAYLSTFPMTGTWCNNLDPCRLGYDLLSAGFSSVVAQQSPMTDVEAALMAAHFYTELLKLEDLDTRFAAKALHLAGIALRETSVGARVWARYIHIGV